MASLWQFGRREEPESGGKILRGRRRLRPFSPYRRPLALPAPETQVRQSPNWLRGLISGAGKLISSVLDSDDSGSSPSDSSACPSDEDYRPIPDDFEDHLLSKGLTRSNERESMKEGNVDLLAIVPKSDSKLLIEQLLMQETFSREECNKMLEIIHSRAVCTPSDVGEGIQNEISNRFAGNGTSQLFDKRRNISGTSNYSPSNLSAFSRRLYADEAITPDLRNRAILETEKWFQEKGLSPSLKFDQECGPCVLNTECFDSYGGSPIEMAKSYMQCLPPWRSASFSNNGFMFQHESTKRTSSTLANTLTTSKDLTNVYFPIGSWGSDENLNILPKFRKNDLKEGSIFRQKELSAKLSVYDASKTSCASIDSSIRDKVIQLHDEKAVELDIPKRLVNVTSEFKARLEEFKHLTPKEPRNPSRPPDGSKIKSIERMLNEPPGPSRVYRRVKKVVVSKRGRRLVN